jgi:WD40 repeat protein
LRKWKWFFSLKEAHFYLCLLQLNSSLRNSWDIREGNLLRATLPGDVLVGEHKAWMLKADLTLEQLSFTGPQPYKIYSHQGHVYDLSWSPTGNYLAAGDGTGMVLIHSLLATNEDRATASYQGQTGWHVEAVAWSPHDTRFACAAGYDGDVHLWMIAPERGHLRAAVGSIVICRDDDLSSSSRYTNALAWLPNASSLYAGREDGFVLQWHAATGTCLSQVQRHQKQVTDLAISPDGTRMASASADGTVHVWSLTDSSATEVIYRGHTGAVLSVDWSPDGSQLISCAEQENCLHLWDATTGQPGEHIPLSVYTTKLFSSKAVGWSPIGTLIAAACDNGTLQVFDARWRRHVLTYRHNTCEQFNTLAWSPDGRCIAAGGSGGYGSYRVFVWQVEADTRSLTF